MIASVGSELMQAMSFAFAMFWEILWPLVLGFGESAQAKGSMVVDLIDSETGQVVGTETITFDVTINGKGAAYPGAGAQTDPEPAVGATVTLLRDAIVVGGITSPSLGYFNLTERRARLGQSQTVELAPLAEPN